MDELRRVQQLKQPKQQKIKFDKLGWWMIVALLLVALSAVLAGCAGEKETQQPDQPAGSTSDSTPSTSQDTDAPPATNKPEPITLTFFEPSTGQSYELFMEQYGAAIEEKFPHITANFVHIMQTSDGWVQLPELLASGTHIDIVFASIGALHSRLIAYDLQSDISDLIKKYNYDLNRLDDTAVGIMKGVADGGMYGLPVTNYPSVLVYNRDLFEKFGVDFPRDDMTWDEVYDVARAMTRKDGDVEYRGFATSFSHIALMNQLSANFVDPATDKSLFVSDPKWAKHVENLVRFFQIPGNEVPSSDLGRMNKWFVEDQIVAMNATQVWLSPSDPMNNINWDLAVLPEYSDLRGIGSQPYPLYFNITKMASEKARNAAFEVIAYLTSDEYQLMRSKQGILPTVKNPQIQAAFGAEMPFLEGRNVKALMPPRPADASVWTKYTPVASEALLTEIDKMLRGEIDLNTALRQAAEETERQIAEDKAK